MLSDRVAPPKYMRYVNDRHAISPLAARLR